MRKKEIFIRLITTWGAIGLSEKDQKWYNKNRKKMITTRQQETTKELLNTVEDNPTLAGLTIELVQIIIKIIKLLKK